MQLLPLSIVFTSVGALLSRMPYPVLNIAGNKTNIVGVLIGVSLCIALKFQFFLVWRRDGLARDRALQKAPVERGL